MPVLVRHVRRAHCDPDGEEGQQRGDEVGPRVQRLRDEAEAVRGESRDELDRQQESRRDDGHECGSTLWAHTGRLKNDESPPKRALTLDLNPGD